MLTPSRWRTNAGTQVYADLDDSETSRLAAFLNWASAMGFRELYEVIA